MLKSLTIEIVNTFSTRGVRKEKIWRLPESPKTRENLPEYHQQELSTLLVSHLIPMYKWIGIVPWPCNHGVLCAAAADTDSSTTSTTGSCWRPRSQWSASVSRRWPSCTDAATRRSGSSTTHATSSTCSNGFDRLIRGFAKLIYLWPREKNLSVASRNKFFLESAKWSIELATAGVIFLKLRFLLCTLWNVSFDGSVYSIFLCLTLYIL